MSIRMGLHIQGAYGEAERYIRAVQPPVVKFLDDAPPHLVSIVNGYGGLSILRVYRQDQDPGEFGQYLKEIERAAAGSAVRAIEVSHNEAHQAGDELTVKAELDIAGMKLAERLGKVGIIGCFSVGMPDLPEWQRYRPALQYAAEHGHLLGLHEYGGGSLGMDAGVTGNGAEARGWYCLRYRKVLDWAKSVGQRMPRIVITEAGIDDLSPGVMPKTRGYQTARELHPPSVGDYASQAARYARHLAEDGGAVVGWVDFGFGAQDPAWHAFDLSRDSAMLDRMIDEMRRLPDAAAPPKPPKEAPMADLGKLLVAEFGERYADLRSVLPRNPHGPAGDFGQRPLAGIDTIAIHHTAGPKGQGWDAIAASHVSGRGWAGIGYHVGVKGGRVSYLGDAGQARACCQNQNHRVLCVVLTGNYETEQVDPADAEALRRVVAVIQRWAGRTLAVKGHREVPGQQTACPGRNLLPLVHELAAGSPGLPPVLAKPSMAKVVWALEQSTRVLEREGLASEAAFVAKQYTADAIKRRDGR